MSSAGDRVGDPVAEREVGLHGLVGRALRQHARPRQQIGQQRRRVHQRDAVLLQRRRRCRRSARRCSCCAASPARASSVRSGITSVKSLTCLTCPAMTASVTPAAFSVLMHVPSWPSGTQANGRAAEFAAQRARAPATPRPGWRRSRRRGRAGARRAARGTETCRCPAIRPRGTAGCLLGVHQVVHALGWPPQNDAALGRGDEVHEVADFGRRQRRVALDQLERAAGVVLDEMPIRPPQLADQLAR